MEFFLSLEFLILSLAITANIILAVFVYRNNKHNATNKIFLLLSLLVSAWLLVMYVAVHPQLTLFWSRMTLFFAAPMNFTFLLLAHTLPNKSIVLQKKSLVILLTSTVLVMTAAVSPHAFTEIVEVAGSPQVKPGPGMTLFGLFTVVMYFLAFHSLIKKLRRLQGIERKQVKLVMAGILLMIGLLITTVMLPVAFLHNRFFVPFAPLYTLLFLIPTAVAIIKYRLFDIQVVFTEVIVVVATAALLIEGLLSDSVPKLIFKILFAVMVGFLGILLIKSVHKEIRQRKELAALASSLEQANIRLQELDQQKTEFLSIASHQLRTPLSVIKGYLQLIKDKAYGKVGGRVNHVLDQMDQNNEHLVKLIDEFLDITRMEQGRTKYDFAQADLNNIIHGVVADLSQRAQQKDLSIQYRPSNEPISISGDKEKIHHVIFNFVDNAIKYSDYGSIRITVDEDDAGYAIRVRDQGLGFEKEDGVNFFQKFYRGNNVKGVEVNGTGLGLYVCRKFIEGHGGKVWALSKGLGKGSEFGFWIPRRAVAAKMEVVENEKV